LVASSRCRGVLVVRNLAKSISTSKTTTTVGEVDLMSVRCRTSLRLRVLWAPNVRNPKPGSEFKVEQVVIENSEDPNVPGEKASGFQKEPLVGS
jgi:hypothetical protein